MEGGFVLGRWRVVAGGVDAPMVAQVHPFERLRAPLVNCENAEIAEDASMCGLALR